MLKDACGGAVLWACGGAGGTGASASGVGTCAVRWTGLPQFEQNRSSGCNSCPQLLQYLSGTSAILPCLLFRLLSHVVGHPLDAPPGEGDPSFVGTSATSAFASKFACNFIGRRVADSDESAMNRRDRTSNYSPKYLEAVMNSIRNVLGMRETEIAREPRRPWNPHFYAVFAQVHNTL